MGGELSLLLYKSAQNYEREGCIHSLTKIFLSAYHEPAMGRDAKNNVENATTWTKLENIILSETSQTQKVKCCVISPIEESYTERQKVVSGCQGLGEGEES